MMLAVNQEDARIQAEPGLKGTCPICKTEVIPKCGEIKTWHWAHKSLKDCDHWAEPESEWHYHWKIEAGIENTEIVIQKDDKIHRADIKTTRGLVIELQHSPLSPQEVREREEFYGNMIWVIDGDEVCPGFMVEQNVSREEHLYFKHSGVKKAWVNEITKPCFIHFSKQRYDTYYYYQEFRLYEGILNKSLKKSIVPGGTEQLNDVMIQLHNWVKNKRYCSVMSKRDFIAKFIPPIPRRQKSLFSF
jgi:competence CoiA-like predicted nuclease